MSEEQLNRCLEHMHFAFRNLVQEPDRILAKHGLGRAHHRALYFIRRHEPSVGQLARTLNVSNQALHHTTRDLILRGLIRSQPDPEKRTIRRLSLTAKGKRLEQKIDDLQRNMFAAVARIVGAERMAVWAMVMDTLAAQRPA